MYITGIIPYLYVIVPYYSSFNNIKPCAHSHFWQISTPHGAHTQAATPLLFWLLINRFILVVVRLKQIFVGILIIR